MGIALWLIFLIINSATHFQEQAGVLCLLLSSALALFEIVLRIVFHIKEKE